MGQVRVTIDVDLTLLTEFGKEAIFIDALLRHFDARIPNGRAFALQNRVLLLVDKSGMRLNISCGAFSFEQSAVKRSKKFR